MNNQEKSNQFILSSEDEDDQEGKEESRKD